MQGFSLSHLGLLQEMYLPSLEKQGQNYNSIFPNTLFGVAVPLNIPPETGTQCSSRAALPIHIHPEFRTLAANLVQALQAA